MRFAIPFSLAALGAAVVLPATQSRDGILSKADLVDLAALPDFPEPLISTRKNTSDAPTTQLDERAGLQQNKLYQISGWAFYIGSYILDYYSGTSWEFPSDAISITYIADQVASDIRTHPGYGNLINNVGGGWSYFITLAQGYTFNNIPYSVIWGTVTLAIQGAHDWVLYDNAFTFTMEDSNHGEIFTLQVFPTNHGSLAQQHDEF
ncbi:hypothetical protein NQ176_g619 [Zarea fungicola]|uniref:Uncharacterized protein n=1 Tax=Zarea fungicola TaxID=93591 RepID=A0ACC1NZ13_9HYPO|nr:hypothetical protein NQ176_g619 [Lecanicillium fungicola]